MAQQRSTRSHGTARVLLEPGMWNNLRLAWRLFRDSRVAPLLKLFVPILVLLYLVSPIDLIPDVLLGIGQLDDIGVMAAALLLAIRLLPRLAPDEVVSDHLRDLGLAGTDAPVPQSNAARRGQIIDADYRAADPAAHRGR